MKLISKREQTEKYGGGAFRYIVSVKTTTPSLLLSAI